ncbi:hypothetical protein FF011L_01030 [Roseimaritima multifibrata]|uniref:Zinc-ribbon domain-containing protein n=1 Tax=Roseimaritima multifibrata TaxID=1930274 RepID=A0A517M926_9BACT|nr:zinc ribbon domain-containing protein [Roseimaritima multifibrata]QDS91374.1 hypothetical protein FF011L_01030 [Roseimaritima multifibrata]
MGWFRRRRDSSPDAPLVPCPHCGADVRADAVACRECGYAWEADDLVDDGSDDFDYDAFVEREFSESNVSQSLPAWQRFVIFLLVLAFAATLLGPLLF